jgi:uncharacterized protein DUF1259
LSTAVPTRNTGDFVLVAKEVNPVLKELLGHGIEVTALHSHMLDEQPRLFFMHFWANDDAQKLAKGLRAALDKVLRHPLPLALVNLATPPSGWPTTPPTKNDPS